MRGDCYGRAGACDWNFFPRWSPRLDWECKCNNAIYRVFKSVQDAREVPTANQRWFNYRSQEREGSGAKGQALTYFACHSRLPPATLGSTTEHDDSSGRAQVGGFSDGQEPVPLGNETNCSNS